MSGSSGRLAMTSVTQEPSSSAQARSGIPCAGAGCSQPCRAWRRKRGSIRRSGGLSGQSTGVGIQPARRASVKNTQGDSCNGASLGDAINVLRQSVAPARAQTRPPSSPSRPTETNMVSRLSAAFQHGSGTSRLTLRDRARRVVAHLLLQRPTGPSPRRRLAAAERRALRMRTSYTSRCARPPADSRVSHLGNV